MTTTQELTPEVRKLLNALAESVRTRLPSIHVRLFERSEPNNVDICASFMSTAAAAAAAAADVIDLCVKIQKNKDSIVASADLVRGGTGDILNQMAPLCIFLHKDTAHDELLFFATVPSLPGATILAAMSSQ